jgi:hypothetical protein
MSKFEKKLASQKTPSSFWLVLSTIIVPMGIVWILLGEFNTINLEWIKSYGRAYPLIIEGIKYKAYWNKSEINYLIFIITFSIFFINIIIYFIMLQLKYVKIDAITFSLATWSLLFSIILTGAIKESSSIWIVLARLLISILSFALVFFISTNLTRFIVIRSNKLEIYVEQMNQDTKQYIEQKEKIVIRDKKAQEKEFTEEIKN